VRQHVAVRFGQALRVEAVLLTGLFGVGKSTIAAEMADRLEDAGVPYAALDLDWLTWCNVGDGDRASEHAMLLRNLDAVVANYRASGVRYYVLARWIQNRDELADLAATMAMPLHTVELAVPLDEITRRLATDPTAGRRDDLAVSAAWAETGRSAGLAEYTVDNDRPVRDVAADILRWLAWPPQAGR
jgi:thymidylate kinase